MKKFKKSKPELLKTIENGWDGINQDILIVDLPEGNSKEGIYQKQKRSNKSV